MDQKAAKIKLGDFWEKYEVKIVLLIGFVLVAVLSFEFGLLQGQKWQQSPVIIERSNLTQDSGSEGAQGSTLEAQKTPQNAQIASSGVTIPAKDLSAKTAGCAFVGSKNSTKYHAPTCRWAKQIKPENIVCFASAEAATAKNYQPDKGCIK